MQYRTLGKTGLRVSALSFGGSSLGGVFRDINEAEAIRSVLTAIDLGMNFIDTSPFYGITKAETVLGKALKQIPRDRYYLATKVGRYGMEEFDFSAERTIRSVDESLRRMNVDYVDIIQCHDIEFGSLDQAVNETIPALRQVRDAGKARFIGVTGLPLRIFPYVLDRTEVDTILSYCHYSMNDRSLDDLVPYLAGKGVGIINASPLSMGLLTKRGAPAWHPATAEIKEVCAKAAAYCTSKGADIAKLAVQFSIANPSIATTLVGTASPENIKANIQWADEPMDIDLFAEVDEILRSVLNKTWPVGRPENN